MNQTWELLGIRIIKVLQLRIFQELLKERTKEIGTRKALGARRRTILLQFLIEAVSICLIGGAVGLSLTFGLCLLLQATMPSLPVVFSFSLVIVSMVVAVVG
mgnify:CR=1 FL=1